MASVTSLDQDMRRLRLGKANPQASNEARTWIESTLGQKLPPGDLMDALKDGIALCQLASLALPPPGIKFKKSAMPFMQMENISHFLRACEQPPFNLHAHDRFLTVDLYEKKDPAQVLQCIGAFSRVAHAANPSKFPTCIGPKKSGMSPASTGNGGLTAGAYSSSGFGRNRGLSNVSTGSSTTPGAKFAPIKPLSPSVTGGSASSSNGNRSPGPVSTWSKRSDQGVTAPAWNIAQYGYMGGANQGSQGVAFGARRQITSAAPHVPSLAEKERKRKEQEAEAERLRLQAEEAEHKRRVERESEEEQAKIEEERRWEEETRRRREEEKRKVEQQKREWEDQERKWKEEDERKMREEKEAQEKLETETHRPRGQSNAALRGQYLSDYQAQQGIKPRSRQVSRNDPELEAERMRVAELERQLQEAKERERQYQREREGRSHPESSAAATAPARPPSPPDSNVSWAGDEREFLRSQWQQNQQRTSRPLPDPKAAPTLPSRPLPEQPSAATAASPPTSPRPLPNPPSVASPKSPASIRSMPLSPVPKQSPSSLHTSPSQAQQKKPGGSGWASKSLLEREMERERERQREWEEGQKRVQSAARDVSEGSGPGQTWDVHQYGTSSSPSVAVDFSASSASVSASRARAAAPGKILLQPHERHDQDLSRYNNQFQFHGAIAIASSSIGTPSTPATPATPASESAASDAAGSSYWDAIEPDNDDEWTEDPSYCNTVSELDLNDAGDVAEDEDDDAGWWDQLADEDEYWRDTTPAPTADVGVTVREVRCSA